MGKKIAKLSRLNWDVCALTDMATGHGFYITDPPEVEIDETKKKSLNGPQSPMYGTTFDDEQAFSERYRCDCGAFYGFVFKDEVCPYCGKPVTFRDVDVKMTGWIPLGQRKIIAPHYYRILQQAIGKDDFTEIVYSKRKVDRDGKRTELTKTEKEELGARTPYFGMGVEDFRMNFDEILDYFIKKKPNKESTLELVRKERLKVFTSNVPVYTNILRPQAITSESFYFTGIDKDINTTVNLANSLRNQEEDIEIDVTLGRLQARVNSMWEFNFDLINSKDGLIRDQLIGGSLNFTARNVICPDPTLKDNEIDLGYPCFRVMFKFKIIYYLMQMHAISMAAANQIWEDGAQFDQRIQDVIDLIVQREEPMCIINRNPTLNYYSILRMKIRRVVPSSEFFTMMVPLSILPGLNADFDGDILNIIGIMDDSIKEMFKKYDPVKCMITSRDTGLLNDYFAVTKSQKIDVYHFCTL